MILHRGTSNTLRKRREICSRSSPDLTPEEKAKRIKERAGAGLSSFDRVEPASNARLVAVRRPPAPPPPPFPPPSHHKTLRHAPPHLFGGGAPRNPLRRGVLSRIDRTLAS